LGRGDLNDREGNKHIRPRTIGVPSFKLRGIRPRLPVGLIVICPPRDHRNKRSSLMNQTIELLLNRRSVRAYDEKEINEDVKARIFAATLRAPTAGNMTLYSIIEVKDQSKKNILARTCDNQPFIAKAPFVLLFLADYQKWYDYFQVSGVEGLCNQKGIIMRTPQEGDLFLACCDALIAAQTAVIAAESLGIGSCYIGDIMENYEKHKELFELPKYVFPISLICFGYPTKQQRERKLTRRFDAKYVIFENQYHRLGNEELEEMYRERQEQVYGKRNIVDDAQNFGQMIFLQKFNSDFALEMNRSVRAMMRAWIED
jgi:nitroreductase